MLNALYRYARAASSPCLSACLQQVIWDDFTWGQWSPIAGVIHVLESDRQEYYYGVFLREFKGHGLLRLSVA